MNFKTTVVLIILLVVAGAYFAFDRLSGRGDRETGVETASDSHKLFDVKNKDDVNSVTIKSQDGSEIVLAKSEPSKWRMTKPVEAPAENWQVDSLVRDLLDLESKAAVDPKDKGLDKPRFHIEMSARGGKLLKFDVGEKNQLGDMYVRVEGHKDADVVSSDVYERLSKPANELRDKQLVTVSSPEIRQLAIQTEGQRLLLQKKGSEWELAEPKKLPVDEAVATDLLGAVTGLRASDWIAKDSPDIAKAQFDKPQMTVSFTTAAPTTQPTTAPASQPAWTTVTFGQYEDIRHQKLYARISDTQAVVKTVATPIETLTKKPFELRDKRVADIVPEQVSKVSILTDIPASATPATQPTKAKKSQVVIERRPKVIEAHANGNGKTATTHPTTRAVAKGATTRPTTQAVASATTQAATTKPVESTWVLKSDPKGDADDPGVQSLLDEIHPLRVSKYLEATPTTKPTGHYEVDVTTIAPGGASANHQLKLIDPGHDQPVLGEYNGLSFELPRTFLTKIEGNFAKKPTSDTAPKPAAASPDAFKLPGEK
jgi:hypothetical protein